MERMYRQSNTLRASEPTMRPRNYLLYHPYGLLRHVAKVLDTHALTAHAPLSPTQSIHALPRGHISLGPLLMASTGPSCTDALYYGTS